MPDIRAKSGEERIGVIDPRRGIEARLGLGVVMRRQILDLLDVEDRVALHVGDRALGLIAGDLIGLGTDKLVGVDDRVALLALADMSAQLAGLAVGHPDRRREALRGGCGPEHQDVDAGIGLAILA